MPRRYARGRATATESVRRRPPHKWAGIWTTGQGARGPRARTPRARPRLRPIALVLAAAVVAGGAAATGACAATVAVDGDTLVYQAAAGEINRPAFERSGDATKFVVDDYAAS